ncbi:MAG: 30S ribosomal protein S20 [Spirochaetia bacterium]
MAAKGSAFKRLKQSLKRRERNRSVRSRVRTNIRKFRESLDDNNVEQAADLLKTVTKLIDTAAGKGVYHKNTAARTKSRLYKQLNKAKSE